MPLHSKGFQRYTTMSSFILGEQCHFNYLRYLEDICRTLSQIQRTNSEKRTGYMPCVFFIHMCVSLKMYIHIMCKHYNRYLTGSVEQVYW